VVETIDPDPDEVNVIPEKPTPFYVSSTVPDPYGRLTDGMQSA
jgi:hypothetical protein